MKIALLTMTSLVVAISAACLGGGPVDVTGAEDLLSGNDLPGASAAWAELEAANPDAPEVLIGVAYDHVLSGNWDAADAALAKAAEAGDEDGKIRLRRALVALQSGDNDRVEDIQTHGLASGTPLGKLLAAEVHLVNIETDEATTLLKEVRGEPGTVGETAEQYLALIESGDIFKKGLAEVEAVWAIGLRSVAVESAEEMLKSLDDADPDKAALCLLWAGRAVTSGRAGSATALLDELNAVGGLPSDQQWRAQATRAMVFVADGEAGMGAGILDALQAAAADGQAPYEGVMDARATAAALAASPADARLVAGDAESAAAARGLFEAGASRVARDAAPSSTPLATFLENR